MVTRSAGMGQLRARRSKSLGAGWFHPSENPRAIGRRLKLAWDEGARAHGEDRREVFERGQRWQRGAGLDLRDTGAAQFFPRQLRLTQPSALAELTYPCAYDQTDVQSLPRKAAIAERFRGSTRTSAQGGLGRRLHETRSPAGGACHELVSSAAVCAAGRRSTIREHNQTHA